ncbi:hypothetical protein, partial [Alishewanella sp. HH-ZS]|uniref:hypothetical protein n=1 Tax=Alishewanella sp. HH-ZS TaxID=1856684 RepID=UPI001C4008AB
KIVDAEQILVVYLAAGFKMASRYIGSMIMDGKNNNTTTKNPKVLSKNSHQQTVKISARTEQRLLLL